MGQTKHLFTQYKWWFTTKRLWCEHYLNTYIKLHHNCVQLIWKITTFYSSLIITQSWLHHCHFICTLSLTPAPIKVMPIYWWWQRLIFHFKFYNLYTNIFLEFFQRSCYKYLRCVKVYSHVTTEFKLNVHFDFLSAHLIK